MRVVGYSDRLSVAPGETIRFMVSCEEPAFELGFVRLRHGDLNPAGPGFRASEVGAPAAGRYPGVRQALHPGSYARVAAPELALAGDLSLAAYVYPTTPGDGRRQVLLGRLADAEQAGYALELTPAGALALRLGDGQRTVSVATGAALHARTWYLVAGAYDAAAGCVRLLQLPLRRWPGDTSHARHEARVEAGPPADGRVPFLLAAGHARRAATPDAIGDHFNGKLDRPLVARRALGAADLHALEAGASPAALLAGDLVAAWDLAAGPAPEQLHDGGPAGLHGRLVNYPTRAVTGHNWTGHETRASLAPDQYAAVHFHADDLADAGWQPAASVAVPADWRSGVYAARLTAAGFTDYVPFFVRPARGAPTADIAFLAPTYSYLAYAQDHMHFAPRRLAAIGLTADELIATGTEYEQAAVRYILDNKLIGLYDEHADGSPNHYSSRLRPIPNMRPRFNKASSGFRLAHQLNGDLYLVDWLEEQGYTYDVVTDEDLDAEGAGLLEPYRAVITGSHPEYPSGRMLDAIEEYLGSGGRLMYLGGNGFMWVTSADPQRPHVIECRRNGLAGAVCLAAPGTRHHSTTGEQGGLWSDRGRPSEELVGVATTAIGFDRAEPYARTPASRDPRAAFIFEGVGDGPIGEHGLHLGGAAGWEIDRADTGRGTPPHALVLASSAGHSDTYASIEPEDISVPHDLARDHLIHADMVFFETPSGGAVFAVGSITWSACLSWGGYRNPVSTVTRNVLERFRSPVPFEVPRELDQSGRAAGGEP